MRKLNIQMGMCNDDGIAIKTGRDQDRGLSSSENIIIRDNDFTNVVGCGFCIEPEMSEVVCNVFIEDNSLDGCEKYAFQFKSNLEREQF